MNLRQSKDAGKRIVLNELENEQEKGYMPVARAVNGYPCTHLTDQW